MEKPSRPTSDYLGAISGYVDALEKEANKVIGITGSLSKTSLYEEVLDLKHLLSGGPEQVDQRLLEWYLTSDSSRTELMHLVGNYLCALGAISPEFQNATEAEQRLEEICQNLEAYDLGLDEQDYLGEAMDIVGGIRQKLARSLTKPAEKKQS